jgi:hypothetical protein
MNTGVRCVIRAGLRALRSTHRSRTAGDSCGITAEDSPMEGAPDVTLMLADSDIKARFTPPRLTWGVAQDRRACSPPAHNLGTTTCGSCSSQTSCVG